MRLGPVECSDSFRSEFQDWLDDFFGVRPVGFAVLEQCYEVGRPYLNVWIAWFKPNYAKAHRQELIAWLDRQRDLLKCEWWQFSSPRDGWIGIEPDCKRVLTIWRR